MSYYGTAIKKYAIFSGRANRREFWLFQLVNFLIYFGLEFIEGVLQLNTQPLTVLYALFILLPSLAIQSRRLHDMNLTAWWLLLHLIPFVGGVILLIMCIFKGTDGPNKYGNVSTA